MHRGAQVTDQVMELIKEKITDGSWKLHSRIPSEQELCKEFNVSRTSVRAALQRYNVLGVLDTQRGRGTFVRSVNVYVPEFGHIGDLGNTDPVTRQSFLEWRQARNLMEPEIAYQAAKAATPELVKQLKKINREQEACVGQQARFIEKDREYHMALVHFLHNRHVEAWLSYLLNMKEMQMLVNKEFGYTGGIYFHAMITDAISRRDAEGARTLMLQHGMHEEMAGRTK